MVCRDADPRFSCSETDDGKDPRFSHRHPEYHRDNNLTAPQVSLGKKSNSKEESHEKVQRTADRPAHSADR